MPKNMSKRFFTHITSSPPIGPLTQQFGKKFKNNVEKTIIAPLFSNLQKKILIMKSFRMKICF